MVDWRGFPDDLGRFDVVVASDVLYEQPYAKLIATAFERTIDDDGEGWLADPGRIAAPAFLDEARTIGLTIKRVREVPFEAGEQKQRIGIMRIARSR